MKRIYFSVLLLLNFAICSSVFATNGSNLIGFGAASRGMGGTGIATPIGPDNALKNPALLNSDKNFEMIFGGTYFMPKVSVENSAMEKKLESDANPSVIPEIGFTYKINDQFTFGLGAYGVGGMSADYRGDASTDGAMRMFTSLSMMKFAPALSYSQDNFKVGVSLQIMYGTMSMAYAGEGTSLHSAGMSDDLGFGYDIGAAYDILENLTIGVNYQSPVSMEYKYMLKENAKAFNIHDILTSDELEQPAEIGLGVAYKIENIIATLDYKMIQWANAKGYEDFGWENQNVIALGAAYVMEQTTFRVGYNQADSPLGDDAIKNDFSPTAGKATGSLNFLNAVGFPGIVEKHYTFGASHNFSQNFGLDFSFVYAPEASETAKAMQAGAGETEIKHSQMSYTLAGRWSF